MSRYRTAEPLDSLTDKAWLTIFDEVAVPDLLHEWTEGAFRTGFHAALAMVGVDRREHRGRITRAAIAEAVARLEHPNESDGGPTDAGARRVPAGLLVRSEEPRQVAFGHTESCWQATWTDTGHSRCQCGCHRMGDAGPIDG